MTSQLALLWYRGLKQLRNGLLISGFYVFWFNMSKLTVHTHQLVTCYKYMEWGILIVIYVNLFLHRKRIWLSD